MGFDAQAQLLRNGFLGNELTQHNPVLAFFKCRHGVDVFLHGNYDFICNFAGLFWGLRGNQCFNGVHHAAMFEHGSRRIVDLGREVFMEHAG